MHLRTLARPARPTVHPFFSFFHDGDTYSIPLHAPRVPSLSATTTHQTRTHARAHAHRLCPRRPTPYGHPPTSTFPSSCTSTPSNCNETELAPPAARAKSPQQHNTNSGAAVIDATQLAVPPWSQARPRAPVAFILPLPLVLVVTRDGGTWTRPHPL